MKVNITYDSGSFDRLPDAIGWLRRHIEAGHKTGKQNAMLYVQQHEGISWSFTIWNTKAAYVIEIISKPMLQNGDERQQIGN
jgi:hypothetical protein